MQARKTLPLFFALLLLVNAGCGSAAKTTGWVLVGTGGLATATGIVLATGCTTPSATDPNVETSSPCLPADTWEKAKPAVVTGLVMGIIVLAGGVAVLASEGLFQSSKSNTQSTKPQDPPQPPPTRETCTGSDMCY